MKKLLLGSAVAGVLILGGIFGVRTWRAHVVNRLETRAFARANQLLQDGQPLAALAVVDEQARADGRFAWSALELNALVAGRDVPRLVALYEHAPQRVLANEEASLLVARALFAARQREKYTKLRDAWRGREVQPQLWLALDADVLSLEGKPQAAERLLASRQFSGEAEATRLERLSLYAAKRSLYEAWTLLDRAAALAPRNPDIRSYRAQILEAIGKPAEARVEYVAAHVADPKNPLLRDALAEFYRRQGSYDLALQTWRDALKLSAPDFIGLKEAFWSRVVQPGTTPAASLPAGTRLAPLAEFIRSLPAGRFWDDEAFQRLPANATFTAQRPEAFWLELIERLRTGREKEAADLLRADRFRARSWEPDLETALARILYFRSRQSLAAPDVANAVTSTNCHSFFKELEKWGRTGQGGREKTPVPSDLAGLLKSRNAFAAAFMAAGWREAALALASTQTETEVPAWFAYGFAQCLRFNRGNRAALDYLARQPRTPELTVLTGELLLADHRPAEGWRELSGIAGDDSEAGYRAAWLLAQGQIEAHQFAQARETIQRQARLAHSTTGRELLARVTLLDGQMDKAEALYRALEPQSVEARAFLARRAFERKDWPTARRETEELMRLLPDELQLRRNLLAIAQAEQTHEGR